MYRFTAGAALVLGFAVALGAQAEHKPMSGSMEKGAMKPVMVTGCVTESGGMYMLDHATMSADIKKTKAADTSGDSKMMSYNLMGGELKAHVGHKVQVTGTMAPSDMAHSKMGEGNMNKDAMGTMKAGTLNVKSVKMISTSCS
jgi:hypothetical protein